MRSTFRNSINKYLVSCKEGKWIAAEAYKFEFANFVNNSINWTSQTNDEILSILINSQKNKYAGLTRGIQFIQKSGLKKLSEFISLKDVEIFRELYKGKAFEEVDFSEKSMSYTGLSAWIATLFPNKYYPVPIKGFNETIKYLFDTESKNFPKIGSNYILATQSYFKETEEFLKSFPIEEIYLKHLNSFYQKSELKELNTKANLEKIEWVWIAQDFHLFVFRNILKLYKKKDKEIVIQDENEIYGIEGKSKLTTHLQFERNSGLIKKIKSQASKENKMLNCEVCGFSFLDIYGDIGEGFIEAHHKNPLSERENEMVTKKEDIALVCSNCHRMLHKGNPVYSIEELKKMMNSK